VESYSLLMLHLGLSELSEYKDFDEYIFPIESTWVSIPKIMFVNPLKKKCRRIKSEEKNIKKQSISKTKYCCQNPQVEPNDMITQYKVK
jgi:hypothetical protein